MNKHRFTFVLVFLVAMQLLFFIMQLVGIYKPITWWWPGANLVVTSIAAGYALFKLWKH